MMCIKLINSLTTNENALFLNLNIMHVMIYSLYTLLNTHKVILSLV